MTVVACAGRVYGVRQASARTPYTQKEKETDMNRIKNRIKNRIGRMAFDLAYRLLRNSGQSPT